jgi:hypothetical protein
MHLKIRFVNSKYQVSGIAMMNVVGDVSGWQCVPSFPSHCACALGMGYDMHKLAMQAVHASQETWNRNPLAAALSGCAWLCPHAGCTSI